MNTFPTAYFGLAAQEPRGRRAVVRSIDGLHVRSGPGRNHPSIATVRYGHVLEVMGPGERGWVPVRVVVPHAPQLAVSGWVADTCAEEPGGPWLVPA
jgi:hypothetical protein